MERVPQSAIVVVSPMPRRRCRFHSVSIMSNEIMDSFAKTRVAM
jgi:hypothetical protein